MLDEGMDTKTWIMEGLARAFGICVTLRDSGFDLTEQQILAKLESERKSDCEWHDKGLKEHTRKLAKYNKMSDVEWIALFKKENKKIRTQNSKYIKEAKAIADIHNKAIKYLQDVLSNNSVSDITKNIVKYGLEQLELVKSDREPYHKDLLKSPKELKRTKIKDANWEFEYHTKEITKSKQRTQERVELYKQLRKDIDMVL